MEPPPRGVLHPLLGYQPSRVETVERSAAMGLKPKSFLLLLLVSLFSATAALAIREREEGDRGLHRCKQECERYGGVGERRQCEARCEEQHRRREEERGGGEGRRERGDEHNRGEPREQLEECLRECRHGKEEQSWKCEKRCHEEYRRREEQEEKGGRRGNTEERGKEEEQKESSSRRPYFFEEEHFEGAMSSEHGRVWLLEKFHEHSDLLLGIANYRIAVVEMQPNTFALPVHCDAETILYVASGKGRIGMLRAEEQQEEEIYDIKEGDVLRVRSGIITYMANTDSKEKLYVIKLVKPIALPTEVEAFSGVGGNPDSYLMSFSKEVVEAAYNTEAEEVKRLFGKHKEGIIKASEGKLREMTTHRHGREEEEGGRWPFSRRQSKKPVNILSKRPTYSSERGKLQELRPEDCEDLRELDIKVSFLNLTRGSMLVPSYNTKLTTIAIVVDGSGCVEIVCPHLGRGRKGEAQGDDEKQHEEGAQAQVQQIYQKISSEVSKGSVFVVPPGHPFVGAAAAYGRAGSGSSIQVVCFGIHARDNERIFLAGKKNVWKRMHRAAKELAFGASVEEVDKLLNAQKEDVFVSAPQQGKEERLSSILAAAFAGF